MSDDVLDSVPAPEGRDAGNFQPWHFQHDDPPANMFGNYTYLHEQPGQPPLTGGPGRPSIFSPFGPAGDDEETDELQPAAQAPIVPAWNWRGPSSPPPGNEVPSSLNPILTPATQAALDRFKAAPKPRSGSELEP